MGLKRLHGASAARVGVPHFELSAALIFQIFNTFQIQMNPIFRSVITGCGMLAATPSLVAAEEPADPAKTEIAELRQQVQDLTQMVKALQQQVETRPAAVPDRPRVAARRPSPEPEPEPEP